MTWLVFSLFSLASFVVYDLAGRYLATKSENPRAFAAILNLCIALLSPIIFLIDQTVPTQFNPKMLVFTVIGLTLWAFMGRFEYYAKKHTEASVLAITAKIAPVITFILGVVFLKESFTLAKVGGITLIIIANLLLYLGQKREAVISKEGMKYTGILVVILSFAWIFDAINVRNWGVGTFAFLSYFSPFVLCAFFPPLKIKEIRRELALTPWWQFLTLSIFGLAGYANLLKAYTLGEASSVTPIITSTTPFVVLFGIILLGERDHLARKLLASALALIAIYLMR